MRKILILTVIMLYTVTIQKIVAQSTENLKIQVGPEGDSALYYWNPKGSGGTGHWQLASDSSYQFLTKKINSNHLKVDGWLLIEIEKSPKAFYFDGYWRLYVHKRRYSFNTF